MRVQSNEGTLPRARLDQVSISKSIFLPSSLCFASCLYHHQFNKLPPPTTFNQTLIVFTDIFNFIFTRSLDTTFIRILSNVFFIRSRWTRTAIQSVPSQSR